MKKTALISGATSGIGFELAKLFAADKYNLVIVARSEDELQRTADELSTQYHIEVYPLAKDLARRDSPFEVYNESKQRNITVDILVNDAGQGVYGKFMETDLYRELDIIQLNISSTIVLTKLILKDMLARNEGKILNVGSIAGESPGPWQSVYHGTKAFINSWSSAIANELKDVNITVTLLVPGATDTDFFNKADMQDSKILESSLSDPARVAKDGYSALMKGKNKIISGLKNKAQVAMSSIMTDEKAATTMDKQQHPKDK